MIETFQQRLTSLIRLQVNSPSLQVDKTSALVEDLGLDSLDIVELCSSVESCFDFRIRDLEIDKIKTVEDILGLISAARAKL